MNFKKDSKDDILFKKLFEANYKRVYKVALFMTSNKEEAEDILQEAFISAYTNIEKLKDINKFGPWISTITTNISRKRLKNKRWDICVENEEFFSLIAEDYCFDLPDKILEDEELKETVWKTISDLEPLYKEVIILYYYEDLCYEDISEFLDVPIGTVRSRLSRAKDKLEKSLKRIYFKEGVVYEER